MTSYTNYKMKNNVFAELVAPISSLATTIQLKDWQWARWWDEFPIVATLESIDWNWKVQKREIVKITARSWDYLTVVRWYAPCPSNDDSNTQWTTTFSFWADDTINLYITKEHFDELDKSINDIYDNWVNKLRTEVVSWLQIKVNAWPVLVWSWYYDFAWWTLTLTDNATNYIEIDQDWLLVSNTTSRWDENTKISKVTTSWWAVTNIEDWRLWTVWWRMTWLNIHDLPEKEYIKNEDEIVVADSENIYNNKKVKYSVLNDWQVFWTGSDWDLVVDTSTCLANWQPAICFIEAKTRNFRNLTICSGSRLAFCWLWNPVIRISWCLCNLWIIDTYNWQQALRDCFRALNFWVLKNAIWVSWCAITQRSAWWVPNGNSGRAGTCIWSRWWSGWAAWQNWGAWSQYTMCGYTVYWGAWWAGATCAWWWGWWWWMEWWWTCAQWCDWCPATPCYWWNWWDWWSVSWCSAWWWGWWYWYCRWWKWWNWSTWRWLYWWNWWDSMFCGWDWWQSCCAWHWWYWHLIKWWDWWASTSVYACAAHWWNWWDSIRWNWWAWWRNCDSFNGCGWQPWSWWNSIWWNWGNAWTSASSYCVWAHHWWRWRNWWSVTAYSWWCWWNAIWSRYTLVLSARNFYNNCICANWGNWGNWSTYNWCWWNWTNWWNVYIIYWCCFTQWSINTCWWTWWTGCIPWCAGCDWELVIWQYS